VVLVVWAALGAAASKLFLQTRYSLRRVDGFDATVTVTL